MADLTEVRFSPGGVIKTSPPTVYTRATKADAWELDAALEVTDVAWSCLPTMPTASLTLYYGRVKWWNDVQFSTRHKRTGTARRHVKIVVPMQQQEDGSFSTRTWYGLMQIAIDEQHGAVFSADPAEAAIATGVQQFVAYGFESLLAMEAVRGAWFEFGGGATKGSATIPFNRRGVHNRSVNKSGGVYVFADPVTSVPPWSTRDIVEYLLDKHSPKDAASTARIPFRIASTAWLPDWDDPSIDPEGQTVLGLLTRLVSRQRLLSGWFEFDEASGYVELHTETIVRDKVTVSIPGEPDAVTPGASRALLVISDEDQATTIAVKDSDLPVYDVVVAEGGPEVSVGTIAFTDETLATGWTTTEEALYAAGASGTAQYAAANVQAKQRMNAAARAMPNVERVYSHYRIPQTWDQESGNGAGGPTQPMFRAVDGTVSVVYPPTMWIEQRLPLLLGAEYDGTKIDDIATGETSTMVDRWPLLVLLQDPVDGRWTRVEDIGSGADLAVDQAGAYRAFSVHAHVPPEYPGFVLRVSGAPQYAIASADFTRLDVDQDAGQWNFRTLIATVAIASGRRVQARYPLADPPDREAVRTYYLDAGETFEAVYVVPQTVVGVAKDGTLLRSAGGWIFRPYSTMERLAALAKTAAAWYTNEHHVVTLETRRLTDEIRLGDLIARIGDDRGGNRHQLQANAPVTEIRLSWPLVTGTEPEAPTLTINTFAGELDPIQLQPGNPAAFRFDEPKTEERADER